ncbi:Phage DNA-binding protein [Streptococcus macedonicus]|nr:Phage DNA-binding protein [Streptococcus macedonicus]
MNRLKELRKEKKLTQKELAEETDIPYRTLQRWENGESQIKTYKAELLADFFGVSVGYLLGYDDNNFEKQIRIDTLNDIINHFHKTHISLFKTTNETAFWAGFEAAELIVQTEKEMLESKGQEFGGE